MEESGGIRGKLGTSGDDASLIGHDRAPIRHGRVDRRDGQVEEGNPFLADPPESKLWVNCLKPPVCRFRVAGSRKRRRMLCAHESGMGRAERCRRDRTSHLEGAVACRPRACRRQPATTTRRMAEDGRPRVQDDRPDRPTNKVRAPLPSGNRPWSSSGFSAARPVLLRGCAQKMDIHSAARPQGDRAADTSASMNQPGAGFARPMPCRPTSAGWSSIARSSKHRSQPSAATAKENMMRGSLPWGTAGVSPGLIDRHIFQFPERGHDRRDLGSMSIRNTETTSGCGVRGPAPGTGMNCYDGGLKC
jgi:hypothetical protein